MFFRKFNNTLPIFIINTIFLYNFRKIYDQPAALRAETGGLKPQNTALHPQLTPKNNPFRKALKNDI